MIFFKKSIIKHFTNKKYKKFIYYFDIHINKKTSNKKINYVLENLDNIKPTYIVIPGDLYNVDESTVYSYLDIPEKVSTFINDETDIADVSYVKGNIEQKSGLLPYGLYNNNNPKFHLLCE